LALSSLLGKTPWLFGLPLETHPVYADILRPQSKLLRPIIHLFCMVACLYYFLDTIIRLWRLKNRQPPYLVPFGIGFFLWFLGGLNDGFLTLGVIFFTSEKILWFASFWLSMFLAVAVVLHFRSLELSVREELGRLSHAKDRTIDHLSHELKTPLAVMGGLSILSSERWIHARHQAIGVVSSTHCKGWKGNLTGLLKSKKKGKAL